MAGSTTSIGILVEAQDRATAQLKKIEQQLDSMGKKMTDTSKKSEGFGASLATLAKGAALAGVAWKAFDFLKTSVREFQEAETAMSRLAFITNNATGATQEMVQELFNQAQALEKVGVIDATTIINGQAKLATFDLQTKAIKELTPALLDLVVGEYGLKASSEQVANTANGLGKALQGNVELFTKQGFIVSDAQKEMLKYGDEATRVATINEILGSTYDSLNERMAETAEGRLANLQNRFKSVKEEIGRQLTPTIGVLMDFLESLLGSVENNANGFNTFGSVLYRITNFVFAVVGSLKTLVIGLTAVGDMIWSIGKMAVAPFKAMAQALKGDFGDAHDTLKEAGVVAWDEVTQKADAYGEQVNSMIDKVTDNMQKALTGNGYTTKFNFFGGNSLKSGLGGVLDSAGISKEAKEIDEKLKDLGKSYKTFAEDADDALFDIAQAHKEKIASIKLEIRGVRAEMSALQAEYAKGEQSDIKNVAQQIVAQEGKIAEIQKEMQGDVSQSRYDELQTELLKRQEALTANASFMQSIDGALQEARRVAGLTELEKAIEDYNARRAMASEEFASKMSNLQSELRALKDKRKEEDKLYQEKRDFIRRMEAEVQEAYKKFTTNNLNMTKDAILKEIEYYKMLADAIKASRSGNSAEVSRISSKVTKVNDAIISPRGDIISTHPDDYIIATKTPEKLGNGKGGVTVVIQGGTYIDPQSARKIGDEIIKALELQYKY
jgi:hypothetical protein